MLSSRITVGFLIIATAIILTSCGGGGKKQVKETPQQTAMIEVSINGMTCTGCENTIQTNLEKVPGIISVTASYTIGNAIVEYEPGKVDTLKIKEVVDGLGYTAVKVMPRLAE
jgi:copper chaperone CopZ